MGHLPHFKLLTIFSFSLTSCSSQNDFNPSSNSFLIASCKFFVISSGFRRIFVTISPTSWALQPEATFRSFWLVLGAGKVVGKGQSGRDRCNMNEKKHISTNHDLTDRSNFQNAKQQRTKVHVGVKMETRKSRYKEFQQSLGHWHFLPDAWSNLIRYFFKSGQCQVGVVFIRIHYYKSVRNWQRLII